MWTGENDTKTVSVDANLFENGAKQLRFRLKDETILIKMTLICMKMKLHHMNGFVLRLVLKKRHNRTCCERCS